MPTSEETDDARERLLDQLESGVKSSAKEDMRMEGYGLKEQTDAIDWVEKRQIRSNAASTNSFGIGLRKLVPPGCG